MTDDSDTNADASIDDRPTDTNDVASRLAANGTALTTTDPTADLADLEPGGRAFDEATVIGLGEAAHGTREFFRLKHRLIRYLVERQEVRLFGLEANFAETLALDRYIRYGEGDPEEALAGVYFWTWNTEELLALVEWLRAFNDGREVGDRVRFSGSTPSSPPGRPRRSTRTCEPPIASRNSGSATIRRRSTMMDDSRTTRGPASRALTPPIG